MDKLIYLGHSSIKMIVKDKVIYIDPYAGDNYKDKADLVLITHNHFDHAKIDLVPLKDDTKIIRSIDALVNEDYKEFDLGYIKIKAVPAYNKNHKRHECVGYLLYVNNKIIYVAGDTSTITEMNDLRGLNIDFAFLPCDGVYNMDIVEAAEASKIINAKHTIPYHTKVGSLFDLEIATNFKGINKMILEPNEYFEL